MNHITPKCISLKVGGILYNSLVSQVYIFSISAVLLKNKTHI